MAGTSNKGEELVQNIFAAAANIQINEENKLHTKNVIKAIAKAIAKTNRPHFREKLEAEFNKRDLDAQLKLIIFCDKKSKEKPFKDDLGRITFFKVRLAHFDIPIY